MEIGVPEEPLRPTPEMVLGPFYPAGHRIGLRADLVRPEKGRLKSPLQGQPLCLNGCLLDTSHAPVPGAQVEIWQADTFGRYRHPGDQHPAPLDTSFVGHGVQRTDVQGRFHFSTLKLGAYSLAPGVMRAPHIHFQVTAGHRRLVTQMFFDGEALNASDRLLKQVRFPERLVATVQAMKTGTCVALLATWDIVLMRV